MLRILFNGLETAIGPFLAKKNDEKADQTSSVSGNSAFGKALRDQPLLFAISACLLFVIMVVITWGWRDTSSIEARIRAEIVELNIDAEDPQALVRSIALDAESLKAALIHHASTEENVPPRAVLDDVELQRLRVVRGAEENEFIVELRANETDWARQLIDRRISTYMGNMNHLRAEQIKQARAWVQRKETALQARIDEIRSAILQSPYDLKIDGSSDEEKLLRMLIDATKEAETGEPSDAPASVTANRSDASPGDTTQDAARFTDALTRLVEGQAAQLEQSNALSSAEMDLAAFQRKAAAFLADGSLLSRPAVMILQPVSLADRPSTSLLGKALSVLFFLGMAVLSMAIALLMTLLHCKIRPPLEVASGDFLNDPHWPLPPTAHRELST